MSAPSTPLIRTNCRVFFSSIRYYWAHPPSGNSPMSSYTLFCSSISYSNSFPYPVSTVVVNPLPSSINYTFQLFATNTNGLSSPPVTYQTYQTGLKPGLPQNVSVSSLTSNAVLFSWSPPANTGGAEILKYAIWTYPYDSATNTILSNSPSTLKKYMYGNQFSRILSFPDSNTIYKYAIRAINAPGWTPDSLSIYNTLNFQDLLSFAPSSIAGIALWLDAQDRATLYTSGASVTQWNDKSGNQRHAFTFQSSNPTYSDTALNSKQAVQFTPNAGLRCSAEPGTFPSAVSAFIVFQKTGANTTPPDSLINRTGITNSNVPAPFDFYTDRRLLGNAANTTSGSGYIPSNSAINIVNLTTPTLFHINVGTTRGFLENVNGSNVSTIISPSALYSDNGSTISIASRADAGGTFRGNMGEIILYSGTLTPFNRQRVEGYLAWKWGIQTNLPLSHPFATTSPRTNSVFSPSMLSSLRLWLDAADTSTLTGTTTVSQWSDKSGQNNHVYQAVSAQQPVRYITANGLTGLSYSIPTTPTTNDTGGQWFRGTFANTITNNTLSIFIVASMNSSTQNFGRAISLSALSQVDYAGGGGGANIARNSNTSNIMMEANGGGSVSNSPVTYGASFIANTVFDGTNQVGIMNGTQTGTRAFSASFNIARVGIGFVVNAGVSLTAERWDGTINEVLVFNRNLNVDDRQTVEGYLAWKWALQSNLPLTHPYKFMNPSSNYSNAIVQQGLIVQFDANTYSGSGAWSNTAALGTNFNATIENGTPIKNLDGNGILFNGLTNFTFSNISISNSWTVCMWVKPTGIADSGACYITQTFTGGSIAMFVYGNYNASGANAASNQISGAFYSSGAWRGASATTVALGTWYHLTYTWDGTTIRSYSNGIQTSSNAPGVSASDAGNVYRIGRRWDPTTNASYIRAEIGQILIYNRPIGHDEVRRNYTLTASLFPTPTTYSINTSGLLVRFDGSAYTDSGTWSNTGSLGTSWDATVETGTPFKNTAGNGIVFNGSSSFSFPNPSLGNAWTAMLWYKRRGNPTGENAAIICENFTGGTINMFVIANYASTGNSNVTGGFWDNSSYRVGPNINFNTNQWNSIAITWDGTFLRTYFNATLHTATNYTGVTSSSGGNPYRIGREWNYLTPDYIVGEVGQILLYNRAITANEVLQNYTATYSAYAT